MNALAKIPAFAEANFVRVELVESLSAAEEVWKAFEQQGAVSCAYQRRELIALWHTHLSRPSHSPFIVVGRSKVNAPLFLWPLVRRPFGAVSAATFFCGKHSNYNFCFWDPTFASQLTVCDMRNILSQVKLLTPSVDFLALLNQPVSWDNLANPFYLLQNQISPSPGHKLILGCSGDEVLTKQLTASMRSRLRQKERALQKLPGYRFHRAEGSPDAERLLDSFFQQKAAHFRSQGIPNVFGAPGMEHFIRESCNVDVFKGRPPVELYAIEGGGEVLAILAGVNDGKRFSSMFTSYTQGIHAKHSPGLILLSKTIADCANRGLAAFDHGVGDAAYKELFCNEPEHLFDSFLPLTPMGSLAAQGVRLAYLQKSIVKNSPVLWSTVQTCRKALARWM